MTSREFKASLEDYENFLKREAELKEKIEMLYDDLSGVKGIRYDKIPSSYNPEAIETRKLELIDLINLKQAELKVLQSKYDYFRMIMSKLDDEDITLLHRLFVKKDGYERVCNEMGYSVGGLWKYVDRLIESII